MKKSLFIILFLLQQVAQAQVSVAPVIHNKSKGMSAHGVNTVYDSEPLSFDKALKQLEGSTTYFIVPKGVSEIDEKELSVKLNEVWTLTDKVELINMETFIATDYRGQNVNFISMIGNYVAVNKNYAFSPYYPPYKNYKPKNTTTTWNEVAFWKFDNQKRFIQYADISLTYNIYSWFKKYKRDLKRMRRDLVNNVAYQGNWFNAYIINSLQLIQDKLKDKKRIGGDYRLAEKSQLHLLKQKTLYIPNYVLEHRRGYTKEKDLLKAYKYPVKVVSKEALNKMIMGSSEPIYYLIGNSSQDTEYIAVINSKTGAFIYHDYIGNSIKLKGKHLAKLSKAIAK